MSKGIEVLRIAAIVTVAAVVTACSGGGAHATAHVAPANNITIDLHALPVDGKAPSADAIRQAVQIVSRRLADTHTDATITSANGQIQVKAIGSSAAGVAAALAAARGVLQFRQVLGVASGSDGGGARPLPPAASSDPESAKEAFARHTCPRNGATALSNGVDAAIAYIVACDADGNTKYLLGPTGVDGSGISDVSATMETTTNQWLVLLNFTAAAGQRWYELTKRAYEADPNQSPTTCAVVNVDRGCNQIAIVLDGVVMSAPASQQDGIKGGQTQVTGTFTKQDAVNLAAILNSGPLPVSLDVG